MKTEKPLCFDKWVSLEKITSAYIDSKLLAPAILLTLTLSTQLQIQRSLILF